MDKFPLERIAALTGHPEAELREILRKRKLLNEADEYDLVTPVRALVAHLRGSTEEAEKARAARIKADSLDMDLQRKAGALLKAEDVRAAVRTLNEQWRAAFAFLPPEDLQRGLRNFAAAVTGDPDA